MYKNGTFYCFYFLSVDGDVQGTNKTIISALTSLFSNSSPSSSSFTCEKDADCTAESSQKNAGNTTQNSSLIPQICNTTTHLCGCDLSKSKLNNTLLLTSAALALLLFATFADGLNQTELSSSSSCTNDAACKATGSKCIAGHCRCKLVGHLLKKGEQKGEEGECVPWTCKADADCSGGDAPNNVTFICGPATHLCECDPKKFQLNAEGTECIEAAALSTVAIVLIVVAVVALLCCSVCAFAVFCCGCASITALCCCL
ncbi:hypothetical protein TYRP_021418 [Tyrophagus putrescentiae]|nr:hypothetical protein TYRP_021418 [Tyrophagus putrescentiae]